VLSDHDHRFQMVGQTFQVTSLGLGEGHVLSYSSL
jgi:hypothetical protein